MAQTSTKPQSSIAQTRAALPRVTSKAGHPVTQQANSGSTILPHSANPASLNTGALEEPVVRQWQERIGSSFAGDDGPEMEPDLRWNARHALPLLFLVSSALWLVAFLALRAIL